MQLPDGRGNTLTFGDFDSLKAPYNYVAMVPQWDLLNLLADEAAKESTFTLMMNTAATGVLIEQASACGISYRAADGTEGQIQATLTVACDGRHSVLRNAAGLVPREFSVPFDTWWFRLPRRPEEQSAVSTLIPRLGKTGLGLSLTRPDYFQIAYFGAKGIDPSLRAAGVESFRNRVAEFLPDLIDRLDEIKSMHDVHFLDVKLNRLPHWYKSGFIALGDAAHAMSPAGGVGINLAIQDAVAAGRILAEPLRCREVTLRDLAAVQRRRQFPMIVIQGVQRLLHRAVFEPVIHGNSRGFPKVMLLAAKYLPIVKKLPPRLIGFGPRPEHAPNFARRAAS